MFKTIMIKSVILIRAIKGLKSMTYIIINSQNYDLAKQPNKGSVKAQNKNTVYLQR